MMDSGLGSERMINFVLPARSARTLVLLCGLSILFIGGPSGAAPEGPFKGFAGTWAGEGSIDMSSGATHGRLEIFGVDRDRATLQELSALERRWGVLFQQGALFSSLTVFQNIEFPMIEYLNVSPRLRREVATAKLEMVGLSPSDGKKYPSALSGGMTKRVGLAPDPEIVFLDEPTSGLDPIASGEFNSLIQTLQRTLGITVFMITHDLRGLMTVCDRIAALADGKIVATGSMQTMLSAKDPWVRAYFDADRASYVGRDAAPR
jgi:phospholipid/cholesterol/gamma-HCH transport system ATP-binding protein